MTPDPTVIKEFKADQHAQLELSGGGGQRAIDPSTELTCEVQQLTPNVPCNTNSKHNGWCYIEQNGATMGCAQEILFSKTALASGVVTSLQCLESSATEDAAVVTPSLGRRRRP